MVCKLEMADDGSTLFGKSAGSGDVILMIHGIMSDHEIYDRVQELLGKEFETITYDRRGYGLEYDARCLDYSVKKQAEDAVSVLRRYTDKPAFFVGDSSGGIIALQAAISFPELVRGIFLVETIVPCDGIDLSCLRVWQDGIHQIAESKEFYGLVPLFAKITGAKPPARKPKPGNIKKSVYNIRNFLFGEIDDITAPCLPSGEIKKISCPVIMGISSEGKDFPFGIGAKITADYFGWKTVFLQGHHNTIQEYPHDFCLRIKEFAEHVRRFQGFNKRAV